MNVPNAKRRIEAVKFSDPRMAAISAGIDALANENDRLRADLAEAVALLERAADLLGDRYTLTEETRAFLGRLT